MNDKIKVLFLDIDNTLLDFDAAAAWAMEQCFQKAGLEYKSEMFAAFTEENNKIWQRIERKELTMDDLFYVRWQAILGHLGLEADGVEMEKEFRILLLSVHGRGNHNVLSLSAVMSEKDFSIQDLLPAAHIFHISQYSFFPVSVSLRSLYVLFLLISSYLLPLFHFAIR